MDKNLAKELLFDANQVFLANGIKLGLLFGTLLGAVREGDFIGYDDNDIDTYLLEDVSVDFSRWRKLILDLERANIKLQDVFNNSYYGLVRGAYHIDCFIPQLEGGSSTILMTGSKFIYPKDMFLNSVEIQFLGATFLCPHNKEEYLNLTYEIDWITPKTRQQMQYNRTPVDNYNKIIYTHYMTRA
jgi:lipopolysaccharide cholinephosphotransferase